MAMTTLETPVADAEATATPPPGPPVGESLPDGDRPTLGGGRVAVMVALWSTVALLCVALVLFALEPLFQQREQELLMEQARTAINRAANEAQGLPGISTPTKALDVGSPVAVLEIGRIGVQQVVVEGVGAGQTQVGPGHVPGTAGPGQPGNSALIGRRATFGAPFGELSQLAPGDDILVTTSQGQTVYKVDSVRTQTISQEPVEPVLAIPSSTGEEPPDPLTGETVKVDDLFGPTKDDRLTLVTSNSPLPTNASAGLVVVAKMQGQPFAPTPQNGRVDSQNGLQGDASAWSALLLVVLAASAAGAAAVMLYRRSSMRRVAYLLTTAPLLVFMILLAETVSRLLPAWW